MSHALRLALALALLVPLAGCRRAVQRVDAGPVDRGPDAGPLRDPEGLYLECDLAVGCSGAGQVCFPIRGVDRETAWCSFRCSDASDCPFGICVSDSGTVDDGPRCHELCTTDHDCTDPGFGCFRAGLMTSRGNFDVDACFPR